MRRNNHKSLTEGNRLRAIREERGFTQRELAWVCFQNASEISRYESGKRMPQFMVLRRLCRFFELPVEEIYPKVKEIDQEVDRIKAMILERKENF